jgi:predicted SnoaL-like aldol condensation-catalyzing enzyme
MKKLILSLLVSASLMACTSPTSKESTSTDENASNVEHIFKPTYVDNVKIGDQKNVLLVEQLHQAMFAKDFKTVADFLVDTVVFDLEDGSRLKGKAAVVDFVEKNFSQINVKNFKIVAIFPTVGDNGHQWVSVWDEADVETPDGKTTKFQWMDAFRFENGKIVHFNGFVKSPK